MHSSDCVVVGTQITLSIHELSRYAHVSVGDVKCMLHDHVLGWLLFFALDLMHAVVTFFVHFVSNYGSTHLG